MFSVIIPTYNRTNFLSNAVQSILVQQFRSFEIIIVDDHSDPAYQSELREIKCLDNRIRVIHMEVNQGVSSSRNEGIKLARGEYILFLDDDDSFFGPVFEEALMKFNKEEVDVVIIPSEAHPNSNKDLFHYHVVKQTLKLQPFSRSYSLFNLHLVLKYPPQINSMVFHKKIFDTHQFDVQIEFGEDIYLWLGLICNGVVFSRKLGRDKGVKALIRVHGKNHLSQTSDENVISILKKIREQFARDKEILAIINLKLIVRYLLMRDYKKLFGTLTPSLRNPMTFLWTVGSQFRVKFSIFLSFYIWKYTGIDI